MSDDDIEANRIARELMKLHKVGLIKGFVDARFYATVINKFKVTIGDNPIIEGQKE